MYMANATPNARRPNTIYISPARIGAHVGHCMLVLGFARLRVALARLCVGSVRLRIGSARVFRYQHVGTPNAKFSL